MNTKKWNWSILAFFIPYLVSNIFLFFTLTEKDNKLLKMIEESSKLLNISNGELIKSV